MPFRHAVGRGGEPGIGNSRTATGRTACEAPAGTAAARGVAACAVPAPDYAVAMSIERRDFIIGAAAAVAIRPEAVAAASGERRMYGLIGRMTAHAGQRDALARLLLDGVAAMPGCLSYVVANDPADPDAIWITEAWESREAHAASLSLPSVRAAIAKGRPLIAGMANVAETVPLGGHGLVAG